MKSSLWAWVLFVLTFFEFIIIVEIEGLRIFRRQSASENSYQCAVSTGANMKLSENQNMIKVLAVSFHFHHQGVTEKERRTCRHVIEYKLVFWFAQIFYSKRTNCSWFMYLDSLQQTISCRLKMTSNKQEILTSTIDTYRYYASQPTLYDIESCYRDSQDEILHITPYFSTIDLVRLEDLTYTRSFIYSLKGIMD